MPLRPMQVVNVPVGHVHGFRFVPGTQGWVLTIAAEILDEALLPSEGLRGVLSRSAVVRGTPQIRATMKQIFAEYAGAGFRPRACAARLVGGADRARGARAALARAAPAARPNPICSAASRRCSSSIICERWSVRTMRTRCR